MYNKLGVMYLDVENIQCPFNHTELALPNANGQVEAASTGRRSSRSGSGRQQRGDLKSVVKVAGMNRDAHDVLLELSDVSLTLAKYVGLTFAYFVSNCIFVCSNH